MIRLSSMSFRAAYRSAQSVKLNIGDSGYENHPRMRELGPAHTLLLKDFLGRALPGPQGTLHPAAIGSQMLAGEMHPSFGAQHQLRPAAHLAGQEHAEGPPREGLVHPALDIDFLQLRLNLRKSTPRQAHAKALAGLLVQRRQLCLDL